MIEMRDAMRLVEELRGGGDVVMGAQTSRWGLPDVSQRPDLDIPFAGCMGKGSSVCLGIALAQPGRKVILYDADGSLLMNLGSLVTAANKVPRNLYHFVLDNGMYAGTGGQPTPGAGKYSFEGMARAAGYARAYTFDDLEDFAGSVAEIMGSEGPVFVCLKVVPEIETADTVHPGPRPRLPQTFANIKAALSG